MKLSIEDQELIADNRVYQRLVSRILADIVSGHVEAFSRTPIEPQSLLIERSKLDGMRVLVAKWEAHVQASQNRP